MRSDPSYRVPVILPSSRSSLVAPLALVASVMLATTSGCTASPEPEPTPTPLFATDEEAYAAAEEVYREYNEAGNSRMAGLDEPDPEDFLTGAASEAAIDATRALQERGLHLSGSAAIASFTGRDVSDNPQNFTVSALVCLEVSGVRVIDSSGADVTPTSRPDLIAQLVDFSPVDGVLHVSAESSAEPTEC